MNNGKTKWLLWLAGIVMSLLIIAITTIGNSVIANDKERQKADADIRKELAEDRKDLNQVLSKMTAQLASIETELKYIRRDIP